MDRALHEWQVVWLTPANIEERRRTTQNDKDPMIILLDLVSH